VELPEPDCWLHEDVVVGPSPVAGRGLFARAPIRAGTMVSRLGGRLVSTAELRALLAAPGPYVDTVAVAADRHLILPPGTPNGLGNHSCDPNLWWVGPYRLAARRDVAAGEELTNDYATGTGEDAFRMTCRCGSPLCRGTITGSDWRSPQLQVRYGPHWVPVLLHRMARAEPRPASAAVEAAEQEG
jgi:uncharacterized protein